MLWEALSNIPTLSVKDICEVFLYFAIYRSKLPTMNQTLEFQLTGEGTLPSVRVLRPAQGSSRRHPEMQFGRALVGRTRTFPLVLLNDGNVVAQVSVGKNIAMLLFCIEFLH